MISGVAVSILALRQFLLAFQGKLFNIIGGPSSEQNLFLSVYVVCVGPRQVMNVLYSTDTV